MGSNLCTYRKSKAAPLANHDDSDDEDTSVDGRNSVLGFLKPRCICMAKAQKKEMDHQEKIGQEKKQTLEEWFLSSPSLELEACNSNAGGVQHLKQPPKVCLMTLMCNYERLSSTPRETFSMDGAMLREEAQGERLVPLSTSQSGQRKTVSFRLPEEADIHVICRQNDSEEGFPLPQKDDSDEGAVVGKE